MRLPGAFQSRAGGLVMFQSLARSLAVATDEFLVQQKIMMGLWQECVPMTSGNLRKPLSAT
jgi:hypothetical protein